MKPVFLVVLASSLPLLSACATTGSGSALLGSQANPIKVNTPYGQRAYLARLICPNGGSPSFKRLGSYGQHRDGHIVDGYEVTCQGQTSQMVFMDMYHPGHVENRAPEGFRLETSPRA